MAEKESRATGDLRALLYEPRVVHVFSGVAAFVLYQLIISAIFQGLGFGRNLNFVPLEFLVFVLVTASLFLYATVSTLRSQALTPVNEGADEQRRLQSVRITAYLSKKLSTFCQGIDHSLSAIMFFTRAQLGRKASPQLERDLREVMERIDQVQLLVLEMQRSVADVRSLDSMDALLTAKEIDEPEPAASITGSESIDEYQNADGLYSLRKTARKVVILPITVRYASEGSHLQFHTYTVNVCEEGACIVFSGNDLGNQTEIDIAMPREFSARGRIKWIQPPRESSFRLAGIQFVDQRVEVASL